MRYLNLLLILFVFGCYSGAHTYDFNLTKETKPPCHTNIGVEKVHNKVSKINFHLNNFQERQTCCIEGVTYQVDHELASPILTASIINYYDLNNNIKNNDNFRDNNLNNHSPPKIFISKSSFLI